VCTWPWNEHPRPGHPDRGMLRDLPIPARINRLRPTSGSTAPDSRRTAAELPLALSSWRSGDPVGGRSEHSQSGRQCINIRSSVARPAMCQI